MNPNTHREGAQSQRPASCALGVEDFGGDLPAMRFGDARHGAGEVEQLRLFELPRAVWWSLLSERSRELLITGADCDEDHDGAADPVEVRTDLDATARVLAEFVPASVRDVDPVVVAEVLAVAREWVAAAGPRDASSARRMLWAVAPLLVGWRQRLGAVDAAMLNPRNVEVWVNIDNKHRTLGWRHQARAMLRRVGRVVNPAGWATDQTPIGRKPAALAYDFETEAVFAAVARVAKHRDRAGCLWVAAAGFGAGLNGVEMHAATTRDVFECGDRRLAVEVRGRFPRLVPVRDRFTGLMRAAVSLAEDRADDRFVGAVDKNAVSRIAASLDFGQGGLSLRRARATWLTAHLLAATPLAALRVVAGAVSGHTLSELVDVAADGVDSATALVQALGP